MFDDKNLTANESNMNPMTGTTVNITATAATLPSSSSSSSSTSTTVAHALVKETGFLGQLALLTGGDIIYVPNYVFQNDKDGEMGYVSLLLCKSTPLDLLIAALFSFADNTD
jgi:hypothetical protein